MCVCVCVACSCELLELTVQGKVNVRANKQNTISVKCSENIAVNTLNLIQVAGGKVRSRILGRVRRRSV